MLFITHPSTQTVAELIGVMSSPVSVRGRKTMAEHTCMKRSPFVFEMFVCKTPLGPRAKKEEGFHYGFRVVSLVSLTCLQLFSFVVLGLRTFAPIATAHL